MWRMLEAGMRRRWRLPDPAPRPQRTVAVAALARQMGIHPLTAGLLLARGMANADQAERFLHPKLTHLDPPAALPGAGVAAERLARAVRQHQPIVIYGDYDVDGITATAILWHVLSLAGANVSTYVPHRLDEGFGLNDQAIRQIADGRQPLIISVDCGITAIGPARTAKELGVDLIITDHHTFDPDHLPDAFAVVHPSLGPAASHDGGPGSSPGIGSPLCGAGVAFKLAWQLAQIHCGSQRLPTPFRDLLTGLLSFVALGTIADVAPLVGENRVLTMFGLGRIKHTPFAGLNALIDATRLREENIDAYHVGFALAPRLNACGRMGHAKQAVHLLTAATGSEAAQIAGFLTAQNERRRATEHAILAEAKQMVHDQGCDAPAARAIVLGKPGWHPGVLGIVASRLVEAFGRPVVLLSLDDRDAQGSARSVEGVSIHEALAACAAYLERFGGHSMAAGLALKNDRIDEFREALVRFVNARLQPADLVAVLEVDNEVSLADCTRDLFAQIQRLAPFGRGNEAPRLVLRSATLDRPAERIGSGGRHLSLRLRQHGKFGRAVAFGMGELADRLPGGAVVDLVFEPKISTWKGRTYPDLNVQDARLVGGSTVVGHVKITTAG